MTKTFEQAAAALEPKRSAQLAQWIWDHVPLPQNLSEDEKIFCFGLSLFEEYGDRDAIRAWLGQE
ncbi:hypothetical protein [uncultured Ruthenibacterium sp.]|uniref:hypothetical protein n=1 Tax=uncultured Ruthenibacterium sp. TaxID=1905347 RepID=UPI00349ED957